MKILLLGKGISNNGVKKLLESQNIGFDMLNTNEVEKYDYDLVVKSPGIPSENEVVVKFKKKKISVISDIELVYNLLHPSIVGITGSNGKTSTVNLIYDMIKNHYKTCMCGNIGYSVALALEEQPYNNFYVCELSSFMLEDIINFSPKISVMLNIKPCHLDRHMNYNNYINAKKNITVNQTSSDYLIYNFDDNNLKTISKDSVAKKISFSIHSTLSNCYIFSNAIYLDGKRIVNLKHLRLRQEHNIYNAMASICVAKTLNISNKIIKKVLKKNRGVKFRLNKLDDNTYNDAKSTNPYSTIEAIKSLDGKIDLICGGYDRGEYLDSLIPHLDNINNVYCYGMTKDKVYDFFTENHINVYKFENLKDAACTAFLKSQNKILYSPMFASYDLYESYVKRGEEFDRLYYDYKEKMKC